MVALLVVTYVSVVSLVAIWTIVMFRSNRHFRSAIQHPSLAHHIRR